MKEQGSAALRIVAFAVALAVVLGLASVMFSVTVSAESVESAADDTVASLGTIGNYRSIKFTAGQKLDVEFLYSAYSSSTSTNLYGRVFGYKNGKFVTFNNNNFSIRSDSSGQYHNIYFCGTQFAYEWIPDSFDSAYFQFGFYNNNYCNSCIRIKNGEPSMGGLSIISDKNVSFTDTYGDTMYIVFTAVEGTWSTTDDKNLVDDVINNHKDSDYKDSSITTPSAEFLSFKGTESSGLYLVDWVQAGQQYPIVDFRIDDKGNYHKYALRISGNSNYAEILKGIWDRQEMKEAASAASNAVGVFLLLKAAASLGTKAVVSIAGAATPIGALFLNVPNHDMSGYVMLAAQNKLVKEYDSLSYDDIRTLTSDNMNFSEGSSSVSKAVSLCLSDYVSVVPNTLYKLEIIDVTESKLLDVAYFSSRRGYQKSDSGYGTNITDYDNSADLDNDIDNNNGYTGGSSSNGGKLDTDNPNDIIDTDYNNSLANINISDIIVSLRTSIASVGVFFQSCWALFPPAIWSIILLGLSLIVVLRLLGR